MTEAVTANPEAGWYHAPGDPAGTVRLWNGSAWVGFAQRDPNIELGINNVQAFEPTLGQVRLRSLGILAQIFLALHAMAHVFLVYVLLQVLSLVNALDTLDPFEYERRSEELDSLVIAGALIYLATTILAALFFVIWFWRAYANVALWHTTQYGPVWAIIGWITPFANLVRPVRIMLELMERSPRKDDEGAINPAPAVLWWALWLAPSFVGLGLQATVVNDYSDLATSVVWIQILSMSLSIAALVIAVMLVDQVTRHQDARLIPSDAQVELFEREEATRASLASDRTIVSSSPGMKTTTF